MPAPPRNTVLLWPHPGDHAKPSLGDQFEKSVKAKLFPRMLLRINGRYCGELGSEMKRAGEKPAYGSPVPGRMMVGTPLMMSTLVIWFRLSYQYGDISYRSPRFNVKLCATLKSSCT